VAPIIKAFVDKQRRVRHDNNYAAVDREGHPVELSGMWSDGKAEDGVSDRMRVGTIELPANASAKKSADPKTLLATNVVMIPHVESARTSASSRVH
jgi:hypothetical protein